MKLASASGPDTGTKDSAVLSSGSGRRPTRPLLNDHERALSSFLRERAG
jgi:hypothetical protein